MNQSTENIDAKAAQVAADDTVATAPTPKKPGRSDRFYLLLAFLVICALYLPGQGHALYKGADARAIEVAREMEESSNWAVPTLNGDVFLEKPPLFFASIALSFRLFGVSERTARIPSTIFVILCLMGVAMIGTKLKDGRLGLIMAVVMGTAAYFLQSGHDAYLDVALAAIAVWSLYFFLAGYEPYAAKQKTAYLAAFYAAVSAAFLTKGVIGALVPLLTVFVYLLWMKDYKGFWRIKPWLGIIIFAAVTLPWHIELYREGGSKYFEIFYLDNHLYRFIQSDKVNLGHHNPWNHYINTIWHHYEPWCVLFPIAAFTLFRRQFREWMPEPSIKFALSWLVPAFIVFSIASTKRSAYLYPIYGAIAAVVGMWVLWRIDEDDAPIWERVYIAGYAWLAAGLGFALPILAYKEYSGSWVLFVAVSIPAIVMGAYTIWYSFKDRPGQLMKLMLACIVLDAFTGTFIILPQLREMDDFKEPALKIAELTKDEPALYCMDDTELETSILNFYCKRNLTILGSPPDPALLPGPGQHIAVANLGQRSKKLKPRLKELEDAGMKIDVLFADKNRNRHNALWRVSRAEK